MTSPSKIFYAKPSITDLELRYASDAAANGWGTNCYDYLRRFEAAFAVHVGAKHAMATSSCTGAMHLGLAALGLRPGDEVVIADINWIATVAPLFYLGVKPLLVDVLPDTWCLDPVAVEAAITPRTRAVVAVHLYGNVCAMDKLLAICEKHGIPLIEDAAEAIGSQWHGQVAGSMGAFGTFSFHGTKTITTGEGGMLVTNDSTLFERLQTLANHGRAGAERRQFWPERIGFKYRMSNLQAAIGCAQLERVQELIAGKRRVFEFYRGELKHLPLSMNPEPPDTTNGYWMPTVVIDEDVQFDRDRLVGAFQDQNIDGRIFFWPLSMLPPFTGYPKTSRSYSLYPAR